MNLPEWQEMFGAGPETKRFRLVTKRGVPLLLLPLQAHIAARSLQLYPAQTCLARSFRAALSLALRAHLPTPARTVELPFSASAPIPDFIRRCAGGDREFGILLGNANAPGRRWIFMIFDPDGRPWRILKTGVSPRARELIRAEAAVLGRLSACGGASPRLYDTLDSEVSAVCLEYLPGRSPRTPALISETLSSWLRAGEKRPLMEFAKWHSVRESDAPKSRIASIEEAMRLAALTPALSHGDFAPWNIREHNGRWVALDWERGEECGIPGWDWFHYIVQTEVLVRRQSPENVARQIARTVGDSRFQAYAKNAGFAGNESPLLAGYLLHALHVIRQTEGRTTLELLLEHVSARQMRLGRQC